MSSKLGKRGYTDSFEYICIYVCMYDTVVVLRAGFLTQINTVWIPWQTGIFILYKVPNSSENNGKLLNILFPIKQIGPQNWKWLRCLLGHAALDIYMYMYSFLGAVYVMFFLFYFPSPLVSSTFHLFSLHEVRNLSFVGFQRSIWQSS